jgi:hypothetical protein
VSSVEYTSTTQQHINNTLTLDCQARNDLGVSNRTTHIQVTDVDEGFHVSATPAQPTVGSEVMLSCTVAKYNYTRHVVWVKRSRSERRELGPGSRYTVTAQENMFSHVNMLKIHGLEVEDSGVYLCVAEMKTGVSVEQSLVISVLGELLAFHRGCTLK